MVVFIFYKTTEIELKDLMLIPQFPVKFLRKSRVHFSKPKLDI